MGITLGTRKRGNLYGITVYVHIRIFFFQAIPEYIPIISHCKNLIQCELLVTNTSGKT